VVSFVLVCVRDREHGDRTVEGVGLAQVGRDRDAVAGSSVGAWSKVVLGGGVGRAIEFARSNLRNVPR
jgi:hypothetical protein